ncbi:unnamed protein product [Paramecium primaurelia]|uniref:Transmembrane protein n=1 Tax=Paramecium primaurelia TaxID=5886 RepID=A0A8S1N7Y2_PARPR|nr:unnamed protein product [Paramecium primaurelia]
MIFIFSLFYLTINQETENQVQYLQVGESVQGFISPRTSNHYVYQFFVPQINDHTNFVVLLKTLNPNSDPNIYISKSVQEPLSIQDADVQACEAQGMDICIINVEKIKENDLLYISVVSQQPSRYILRIEFDQEQTLMIDSFLTFKMTSEKQNQEQLEEPFQVFMNIYENGVPNNDKFDYKAIDTWENQKVIEFIQKQSFEQYKILIQGEQGSVFRVSATRSQQLKTIYLYDKIIQVVDKGDYDFYKIEIYDPSNCDIVIRLTPFKGYAKLFVHYNIQPPLLDSYEWKEDNQEEVLIYISRKELLDKKITINILYIAVLGVDLCTYQLQCICEQEGQFLPDIRYQRIVNQQEIMRLEIINYQNQIHQILVNFHILQGLVNILITNCYDQSFCPPEELFVNQEKYEKMTEYIMIYSNNDQQPQFMLKCDYFCNYQIFAIVDRNSQSDGKFEFKYIINKQTTNLMQNTPHKSIIQKNQYQYYYFFVSEQDQIQRLHFIVSLTQGEVIIYLSTKYQKPNEEHYEYKSQDNSINFGGRFPNQPQPGNYYISIYGQSISKYIITVWVINNFENSQQLGKFPWHYIQLYQGDWHDHVLANDEFVLFKIDLKGYQNIQNYPVNVILYKNYGQFQMFGFDHPETNELKAIWQSGQIINIQMNDPKYPEILYLKIRLDQIGDLYGSFRIAFYFYNQEINLIQNEPFFNFLSAQNQQIFRYEYSKKESFIISKRSFELDQSFLIFESFNQYGLKIRQFENTNIILIENKEEIYCQDQQKLCFQYFYFSLYSKIDQFYSILISNMDNSEIQLGEDQPISKLLPIGEDYFYLYCQDQEVNILTFSFYEELKIYASIVQDLQSPHPNSLQYDKISISRKGSYQTSLYISQNELRNYKCVEKCIIKLTVVVSKNTIFDINNQFYDYTIQYNSKLILLRESEFQDGSLIQSGYKFYKIHVSNNNTNLMILLKPDPNYEADLLVSKSKFPNKDKFEWGSFDLYSDVLILEPGNSIHPDLSGDYYVGVLCYVPCQFSLQYHLGNVETYDIFPNQPYNFYVGQDYTIYLRLYKSMQTQPFMIFVQSLSETAYFYVDEIDQFTSKLSYTKNLSSFKYNNNQKGYQKQMITEPLQIDNMLLIALKTYNSEIVTIQVSSQQEEIFLDSQMLFQYQLVKNKKITFTLYPIYQSLILQVYVFSGEITCSYSVEKLNQDENFHPLFLLEIKSDNQKNNFTINNYADSYLKVYIEAIFNSHFSIQYSYEIEDTIYIYSIYPVNVLLNGQSEKKLYYNNYDTYQIQTQQKTFQISVQIKEDWNSVLSNQKHRSLPIIKVYSNITQMQLQPIKQKILSNLIFNEYIQNETQYTIVLNNQAQFYQKYEIQIGNSDLRPLIPRIKQLGNNQLHTSTYWALQQNYDYMFYEMQFCNGIFSVHVGKDFELLKNGQYDYKIDIKQNKQVFGFIDKIDLELFIYLKFDFIKAFNKKIFDAQYTIRIYSVEEKNDIPYDQFYPGLQGVLNSKIIENYEETIILYIEFAPLQFTKKNKQETFWVEQIEYFIILDERLDDDDNNFDYCLEPSNENRIFHNQTDNDSLLTINVTLPNLFKKKQRIFDFTILATVEVQLYRDDQKVQLDYYYESQYIKWNSQLKMIQDYKPINYLLVGLFIVIIILMIGIVAFIRMKRKQIISKYDNSYFKNQKIIGIEMHHSGINE